MYPVQEHSLHSYDMVQISCSKYWYLNNHSQPKHFNQTSLLHSEIFSLFKYRGNFVVKILSLLQHRHRDSCSAPVCQVKICNFFASCRDEERITIKISPQRILIKRYQDDDEKKLHRTFTLPSRTWPIYYQCWTKLILSKYKANKDLLIL